MCGKKNNIVLVVSVFYPEPMTTALMNRDIALYLKNKNVKVIVYAPYPNRPLGNIYEGFKRKIQSIEDYDGVKVIRLFHIISRKATLISRFFENVSLGILQSVKLCLEKKVQVVYLCTWPLFAMFLVSCVCRMRGIPYVVHVKDMYPETIISINSKKFINYFLCMVFAVLKKIDDMVVGYSKKIIVISESFAKHYSVVLGVDAGKIEVVYDWFDYEKNVICNYRQIMNISTFDYVFLYAGSMGEPQGLGIFLDIANSFKDHYDIKFVFVGQGVWNRKLKEGVELNKIKNFIIYDELNNKNISSILDMADVLLLPLKKGVGKSALPSKIISYMYSGKPIIASIDEDSEAAKHIIASGSGYVVEPMNKNAIIEKVLFCYHNRDIVRRSGERGCLYAGMLFDKKRGLSKIENSLLFLDHE